MKARMYKATGELVSCEAVPDDADRRCVALAMYHGYMGDPHWRLKPEVRQTEDGFRVSSMTVSFSHD